MSKIISIHSFRGGTGKSNTTANLAGLMAARGLRVAIVDTDIQSPGLHVLFGYTDTKVPHTLNEYLWGKCPIHETAVDVTSRLNVPVKGKLWLIGSSIDAGEIARILRDRYDVSMLNEGFLDVVEKLDLDVLVIDTHPGVNEETLLSISISDVLVIILRPDQQDFQGTAVTVDVARKLEVERLCLLVNKMPPKYDPAVVKAQVEKLYDCEVVGVIPHSDDMMMLASAGLFALKYPDHPLSALYRQVADSLLA